MKLRIDEAYLDPKTSECFCYVEWKSLGGSIELFFAIELTKD